MKYLNIFGVFIFVVLFIISACKKNCEDCESSHFQSFYLLNNSKSKLKLVFYGLSPNGKVEDSLYIQASERIKLLGSASGQPITQIINFDMGYCDSVRVYDTLGYVLTSGGTKNCSTQINFTCMKNYTLKSENEVKSGKNKSNTYSEFEYILNY